MAVLPPKKGYTRRPVIKGAMVQDVTRGIERSRVWPTKRGPGKTQKQRDQNDWFRNANWAFKYMDARLQQNMREATHRTALYPRDLFTIFAADGAYWFTAEDGTKWFPVATRNAVSESLDALTQTPGYIAIRGAQFWEGVPAAQLAVPSVVGCRAKPDSDYTANFSSGLPIDFDGADVYDTDDFHDPSVNPERLLTRSTDAYVNITAQVAMANIAATRRVQFYVLDSHGNVWAAVRWEVETSNTTQRQNISTGPIPVQDPGTTYFVVEFNSEGDTSTTIDAANTFATLQVVGTV